MQNLKYWGWPIPEYTPITKIILLFTDPREVHPLKDACTEDSFNSAFFCRAVLTAVSRSYVRKQPHTRVHDYSHVLVKLCVRPGEVPSLPAQFMPHTPRGETTAQKCPLKWDFSHFGSVIQGNVKILLWKFVFSLLFVFSPAIL